MCECQTVFQHVKRRFSVSVLKETTVPRVSRIILVKAIVSAVLVTALKLLKVGNLNSFPYVLLAATKTKFKVQSKANTILFLIDSFRI